MAISKIARLNFYFAQTGEDPDDEGTGLDARTVLSTFFGALEPNNPAKT